jgi:hypothetical protein
VNEGDPMPDGKAPLMRADMLGPDCDRLWLAYIAAERDGTPAERDAALSAFVVAAGRQPIERLDEFARAWCAANLDGDTWAGHHSGAPVRLPLLREIVGPALLRGRAAGAAHCARWLAGLWSLLEREDRWRQRLAGIGGPDALLDEAMALDPQDGRAHALRRDGLIASVSYRLHELPVIVGGEAELRAVLDRLTLLGPGSGVDGGAFSRFLAAARSVLDGDRSDDAADEYEEAEWLLEGER